MYNLLENYIRIVFENEENKKQKFIDILNSFNPIEIDPTNPTQEEKKRNQHIEDNQEKASQEQISPDPNPWIYQYRLNRSNQKH